MIETWQPFDQHTEKTALCPGSLGVRLRSRLFSVSFYGQTQTSVVYCGLDADVIPTSAQPGSQWSFTCSSPQLAAQNLATFVGYQAIAVGGTEIMTRHIRIDTTTHSPDGATAGSPAEYWFSTTQGDVLVRYSGTVQEDSGPHYYESYKLDLTSMKPDT